VERVPLSQIQVPPWFCIISDDFVAGYKAASWVSKIEKFSVIAACQPQIVAFTSLILNRPGFLESFHLLNDVLSA